jgi:hypothetical protein
MYRKSLMADVSVNWIVVEFGAVIPEMLLEFWKFAMFAAVGAFDFFAK